MKITNNEEFYKSQSKDQLIIFLKNQDIMIKNLENKLYKLTGCKGFGSNDGMDGTCVDCYHYKNELFNKCIAFERKANKKITQQKKNHSVDKDNKNKIRILDKSKKCNYRCSSCKYWVTFGTDTYKNITSYCSNNLSKHYQEGRLYYHQCRDLKWADNIVDINNLYTCPYSLDPLDCLSFIGAKKDHICTHYSYMKDIEYCKGNFTICNKNNCPIINPSLLEKNN